MSKLNEFIDLCVVDDNYAIVDELGTAAVKKMLYTIFGRKDSEMIDFVQDGFIIRVHNSRGGSFISVSDTQATGVSRSLCEIFDPKHPENGVVMCLEMLSEAYYYCVSEGE